MWPSHVSLYVDCHVCLDRYARENDNRFGGNEEREGRCCPEYESPGYEECVAMLQGPDGGRFESFCNSAFRGLSGKLLTASCLALTLHNGSDINCLPSRAVMIANVPLINAGMIASVIWSFFRLLICGAARNLKVLESCCSSPFWDGPPLESTCKS